VYLVSSHFFPWFDQNAVDGSQGGTVNRALRLRDVHASLPTLCFEERTVENKQIGLLLHAVTWFGFSKERLVALHSGA
jgi:hypothetical protein